MKSSSKRIKAPSTKEDLFTVIQESWNHFDKEYCFKLVKSMSEIIKIVIKAQRRANEYQSLFCQRIFFLSNRKKN